MLKTSMMLKRMLLLAAMTTATWAGDAQAGKGFDHGAFDEILRKHVKRGWVSYSAIKASDLAALDAYLDRVGSASLNGMSRGTKLAFYINAYNAHVIRAVIRKLPLPSVMKVKGFFDKQKHKIAGRRLTLNALENKVIRPTFNEPRIHFALVCAAKSCPPLQSRAFTKARLERMLEGATKRFLNSKRGVQLSGGKAKVSRLFEWYGGDFVKPAGSIGKYIARYRKADAAVLKGAKPAFLHYDWALNGR